MADGNADCMLGLMDQFYPVGDLETCFPRDFF